MQEVVKISTQILVMFQRLTSKGYTLIEVLVVLVLLGLITALVIPNVNSWLTSREKAIKVKELQALFALMPLQASSQQNALRFPAGSTIEGLEGFVVTKEIVVLTNGYCLGGDLKFIETDETLTVQPPLCTITR